MGVNLDSERSFKTVEGIRIKNQGFLCQRRNHPFNYLLLAKEKQEKEYHNSRPNFENTEKLEGGWVGEETLTIAIYCSLNYYDSFEKGVVFSVNYGGYTDSTGAITGNILGLLLGKDNIPERWIMKLEMNEFISQIGEDLEWFEKVSYELKFRIVLKRECQKFALNGHSGSVHNK